MTSETTDITYRAYVGESDLPHIMALVQSELSEPYVIYTYRYFLHQWWVYVHFVVELLADTLQASFIIPS